MINGEHVSAVIPALNEEQAIGKVVSQLMALRNAEQQPLIDDIVVCDNGSHDNTACVAAEAGARVVYQPTPGYGIACQTAIAQLRTTDIVLFVDGDDSCVISQARGLIEAVAASTDTDTNTSTDISADLAIGSRVQGHMESGALTLPQRCGNWLATGLIRLLWQQRVTDLGPFRAIRYSALHQLSMVDCRFGWTVEMQVKAIQLGMTTTELVVDSTRRIGTSKISGTLRGVIGAAHGILGTIIKLRWQQWWAKFNSDPAFSPPIPVYPQKITLDIENTHANTIGKFRRK